MSDQDASVDEEAMLAEEEVLSEEDEFDRLFGIVADGVIGAAGGLVGTAMMIIVLLIGESQGAFSRVAFADLARLVGLDALGPALPMGFALFLLGGMVPWPLLFASLSAYLPGEKRPVSGVFFGSALWTGFAPAFYAGQTGVLLVLYIGVTLVAHWVYGLSLGLVFDYLSDRPDTLV